MWRHQVQSGQALNSTQENGCKNILRQFFLSTNEGIRQKRPLENARCRLLFLTILK